MGFGPVSPPRYRRQIVHAGLASFAVDILARVVQVTLTGRRRSPWEDLDRVTGLDRPP